MDHQGRDYGRWASGRGSRVADSEAGGREVLERGGSRSRWRDGAADGVGTVEGLRTFSSGGISGDQGGAGAIVAEGCGGGLGAVVGHEGAFDAFAGAPEVVVEGRRAVDVSHRAGGSAGY